MASRGAEKMVCRQCHAVLDAGDQFCRQCGVSTADAILLPGESDAGPPQPRPRRSSRIGLSVLLGKGHAGPPPRPSPAAAPRRPEQRVPFWENVWVVLVMLLGVVGPLALPMLWRSRQFTLFWKIVLTVVVVAITALIVAVLYDYCQQMATSLNRALAP